MQICKEYAYLPMVENGLVRLDVNRREGSVICDFSDYEINARNLFSSTVEAGNKLVFVPGSSERIGIYDMAGGTVEFIDYELPDKDAKCFSRSLLFWKGVYCNGCVYMFGFSVPAILKFDINTRSVSLLNSWVAETEKLITRNSIGLYFPEGGCMARGSVFIPMESSPTIVELRINDDSTVIHKIESDAYGFDGIAYERDKFYIIGKARNGTNLYIMNMEYVIEESLNLERVERDNGSFGFYAPVVIDDKLIIFPAKAMCVYSYVIKSNKLSRIEDQGIFGKQGDGFGGDRTLATGVYDNKIIFQTGIDDKWHFYDPASNEIEDIEITIHAEDWLEKYERFCVSKMIGEGKRIFENDYSLRAALSALP